MVAPFDYLDSMSWNIAISAVILGVALWTLRYNSKTDMIDDSERNTRKGFAFALGALAYTSSSEVLE